jgi:hypothetical protein
MGATQTRLSGEQLLWQAYRDAFLQFEREAKRLAEIKARRSDAAEAEQALSRVEQARLAYNEVRDTLAASLMPEKFSRAFWAIPASSRQDQARVKSIAELLWEMAGKPQDSALDDWYRAERVVRHTGADVCCAR